MVLTRQHQKCIIKQLNGNYITTQPQNAPNLQNIE